MPPVWLGARLAIAAAIWGIAYLYLERASDFVTTTLLGLDQTTRLGSTVAFFLADAPKILLLLSLIVFLVGIVRSFFTAERARRALGGRREGVGNVLAATLGIVTPFCSCSAVPMFLGFVESGIPLGVTFSFLISAPMVNEVALALLFGMFGWRVAALYVLTGLAIAISSGWVIGQLKLERWVADWVYQVSMGNSQVLENQRSWAGRVEYATQAVREIVGKVWLYVLVGIALGAAIHGYVPEDFMASIMGKNAWWSVPAAVLVGIPMYSNAAGIIPVVQALVEKGASLGTVLAFMMSVIALSLPEVVILRRVLKWQLIAVFLGVVGTGIIIVGYLFNAIL
ncbi:MAG: permease [Chloroflexi bacterium]|nr:permease [Chloroflexota bacterium]